MSEDAGWAVPSDAEVRPLSCGGAPKSSALRSFSTSILPSSSFPDNAQSPFEMLGDVGWVASPEASSDWQPAQGAEGDAHAAFTAHSYTSPWPPRSFTLPAANHGLRDNLLPLVVGNGLPQLRQLTASFVPTFPAMAHGHPYATSAFLSDHHCLPTSEDGNHAFRPLHRVVLTSLPDETGPFDENFGYYSTSPFPAIRGVPAVGGQPGVLGEGSTPAGLPPRKLSAPVLPTQLQQFRWKSVDAEALQRRASRKSCVLQQTSRGTPTEAKKATWGAKAVETSALLDPGSLSQDPTGEMGASTVSIYLPSPSPSSSSPSSAEPSSPATLASSVFVVSMPLPDAGSEPPTPTILGRPRSASSPASRPTHIICDFPGCSKAFARQSNLKSHKKTHADLRPFLCAVCGAAFRRNHDCMRHEKKHLDQRPYSCPVCFKGFTRQDAVKRHLALHPVSAAAVFVAPPSLGQAVMSSAPMTVMPTCPIAPLAASVGVREPTAFQPYADAFVSEPAGVPRMSKDPQPCPKTISFPPEEYPPDILPPN